VDIDRDEMTLRVEVKHMKCGPFASFTRHGSDAQRGDELRDVNQV
jgi:hypothetical protein